MRTFWTLLLLLLTSFAGCLCVDPSQVRFRCDVDEDCTDGGVCCDGTCAASCRSTDGGHGGAGAGGTAGSSGGGDVGGGSAQGGGTQGGGAAAGGDAAGGSAGGAAGGAAGGDAGGSAGGDTAGGSAAGGSAGGGSVTPIPTGQPCVMGVPCASGVCAQGVCCDRACTGACESCAQAGREGTCAVLPEGTASSCAPFVCDGQASCPTLCTSGRQCANGTFCNSGQCQPTRDAGVGCTTNPQCTSGVCANGVCCTTPCTGSCDRCDQQPAVGTCRPSPMGDPGEPVCGGSVTCNGTNVDCPIPCSAGCPSTTYCAGTLCAAKKPDGTTCATNVECVNGNCVDGVCCDTTCGGGSTSDCQACNRAGSVGTCTILGSSVECRPSTGTCDAPERCDGVGGLCPADATTARNGTDCGSTTTWSGSCTAGAGTCPVSGTESGTSTSRTCMNNTCSVGGPQPVSRGCSVNPNGRDCGTTTVYGACMAGGAGCSTMGTQAGTTTPKTCNASGQCVTGADQGTSRSCTFNPSGVACGTNTVWSGTCAQSGAGCSTSGTEAGTISTSTCNASGQCVVSGTTPTSRACTFNPSGTACGSNTVWSGTCSQSGTGCSTSGTEAGTISSSTCNAAGQCVVSGTTPTSRACTFNPSGASCGANTVWSGTCVQTGGGCATSGSEAGTINTSTCNASGQCVVSGTTPTARTCTFNPSGIGCGTNTVWSGTCSQTGGGCSTSGSEAGTINTSTCNASGSCTVSGMAGTSRTCAYNPAGIACGTTTNWSGTCTPPAGQTCSLSGTEAGSITSSTCSAAGACIAGTPTSTSRACTRNPTGIVCGASVCADCVGPNDACGSFAQRLCTSTGLCAVQVLMPPELCQCPVSAICNL